jgi:hypothetical protein
LETQPTQRELAQALGLSPSQVTRDAAAGMPTTDVEAARAWRERNKRPRVNSAEANAYQKARARREAAAAERAELDLARRRGDLVDFAAARARLVSAVGHLRNDLLRIPARLAHLLDAEQRKALDAEIRAALQTASEGLERA